MNICPALPPRTDLIEALSGEPVDGGIRVIGDTTDKNLTGTAFDDHLSGGDGKNTIKDFKVGQDQINMAGADMDDIKFTKKGSDDLISYDDIKVLVEDVTRAEMMDDGNFI